MYIKLEVTPESRRNSLRRISEEKYHIQVKDKAKMGLANKRALSLLAEHLRVPERNLRLISGQRGSRKLVHIKNWRRGV